jgi:hypothetical protein
MEKLGAVMTAPSSRLGARWTIRRVFIARGAFGEERRRAKDLIVSETSLHYDIHAVRESIWSDSAIVDAVSAGAIRHSERRLAPARLPNYRARNNPGAYLHSRTIERGVARHSAGKLTRREIIRRRLADGIRHQIASRAKDQRPACKEFRGCLHSLQI